MRRIFVLAIAVSIATLSSNLAFAQNNNRGDKNQQDNKQGDQNKQKPPVRPPVNQHPVRPPVNPPTKHPANPVRHRPSERPPVQGNPWQVGQNQGDFHPRPGQIVIAPNRNWAPNEGHRFNSAIYVSIDIWSTTTFGNDGHRYDWDPSAWHYSVEDSLMDLVYVSERTSNTFRASFEQQMTQNGLRSSPGGQLAWDRVQRMDESLERLRSETGSVSEAEMQASAVESLALAQQVANSLNSNPDLMQLVQYEWNDCLFEFNELARYYGEPGIR